MATETAGAERRSAHRRSITVTAVATLAGLVAGVASSEVAASATDQVGLYLLLAASLATMPVLYALGIDVSEFSTKDTLYVFFMTFSLWYVSWGILLSAGA